MTTKKTKKKAVATRKTALSLANQQHIADFGRVLKKYIDDNKLFTQIQGNKHAHADAWKFTALSFGLTPIIQDPERIDKGAMVTTLFEPFTNKYGKKDIRPFISTIQHESITADMLEKAIRKYQSDFYNYKCICELVNIQTGTIMGRGEGRCSNQELNKVEWKEYAVSSMAQTRAIGKAGRNLFGFIMNEAGFEATPAEEVDESPNVQPDKATITEEYIKEVEANVKECKTMTELEVTYKALPDNAQKNKAIVGFVNAQKLVISNSKAKKSKPKADAKGQTSMNV